MDGKTKDMMRLRKKKHWTLQMIGNKYGISKQRVAQIIGKTGTVYQMIEKMEAHPKNSISKR